MNGPGEGPPRKDGRLVLLQGTAEFMEFLEQYEANHRFYVGAGAIYIRGGKRKPVARLQTGMKVLVGKAGVLVNCKFNISNNITAINNIWVLSVARTRTMIKASRRTGKMLRREGIGVVHRILVTVPRNVPSRFGPQSPISVDQTLRAVIL